MEDKLAKIRAEIERLYNQSLVDGDRQADRGLEHAACTSYGKSKVCKELLSLIDSMQEETVSEDLEKVTYQGEEYIRCYHDELDEFANKYPKTVPPPEKRYAKYSDVDMVIAVKTGANWQKQKIENRAIWCEAHPEDGEIWGCFDNYNLRDGEKVKIIVIKEE